MQAKGSGRVSVIIVYCKIGQSDRGALANNGSGAGEEEEEEGCMLSELLFQSNRQ